MVSVVICGVQSRFAVTTGSIPKLSERFVVGSGRGLVSPHPDRQLPLRRASQNKKNEAHPGVGMPLGLCSANSWFLRRFSQCRGVLDKSRHCGLGYGYNGAGRIEIRVRLA